MFVRTEKLGLSKAVKNMTKQVVRCHAAPHFPPMANKPEICPLCAKPSSPDHQPFCSRGCKDRDLLNWLGEGYRVPGPPADGAGDKPLDSEL